MKKDNLLFKGGLLVVAGGCVAKIIKVVKKYKEDQELNEEVFGDDNDEE